MNKHSLVRTIYLYLFSLVGLTLTVIGGVGFVNMGLKAFVFTKADQEQNFFAKQPSIAPIGIDRLEPGAQGQPITLSESERAAITRWLAEYKNWQTQQSEFDPLSSQRHRDSAINLAMILIGLPLYFFHWRLIKNEAKNPQSILSPNNQ